MRIPLPECWQEYKQTGDLDALVRFVETDTSISYLPEQIYYIAIGTADWKVVERLEAAGVGFFEEDSQSQSPMCGFMQEFGDVPETLRWLAEKKGASVNDRWMNDWTPLHYAANGGYIGCVRELIALGADVNEATRIDGGWTPLMEAAARGHTAVVEALLECGADVGLINSFGGGKAIDMARTRRHDEIVRLLENKSIKPKKAR